MKHFKKITWIFKLDIPVRHKKLISTVAVALAVVALFVWLGIGMYKTKPEYSELSFFPIIVLFSAFPVMVLFFSVKRIVSILKGNEDQEVIEPKEEEQENTEE